MPNGHVRQETKKETKSTSSNGWGMFDSLAKLSQTTDKKEQDKLEDQVNNAARQFSGGEKQVQQAINNARTIASGGQTEKQIEAEEVAKAGQVATTTDDTKVTGDKKKKVFTVGKTQVSERLYNLYQILLGRGYTPEEAEKIIKLGVTEEEWADKNLVDLISGEGIKRFITKDFKAGKEYENEFLGSRGAANILNKLNSLPEDEKKDYINRILANNKGAYEIFGDKLKTGLSVKDFEDGLVEANQGNKNFDKSYNKTAGSYWALNPPTTSGDMVDLANASKQEGFEWTKQNTQMVQEARELASKQGQGLAGLGGGGGTQPVDPNDPDAGMMPSGTYLASQYNKALMPDPNLDPYKNAMYATGIEQQHLAGGYWDPNKQEWVGSPWGTQNLWQGANPPMMAAEGGPVRAPSSKVTNGGGGLFNFKAYGF